MEREDLLARGERLTGNKRRIFDCLSQNPDNVISFQGLLRKLPDFRDFGWKKIYGMISDIREAGIPVINLPAKGWGLTNFPDDPDRVKALRDKIDTRWREDILLGLQTGETTVTKIGHLPGHQVIFVEQNVDPLPSSPIVIVEPENEGSPSIIEFRRRPQAYIIFKHMTTRTVGLMTYYRLKNLMKSSGFNADHYTYGTIYQWLEHVKEGVSPLGLDVLLSPQHGWAIYNPTIDNPVIVEKRLKKYYREQIRESFLRGRLDVNLAGQLGEFIFYFVDFDTSPMPQPELVIWMHIKDPLQRLQFLQFNRMGQTKEALRLLVKNQYIDGVVMGATNEFQFENIISNLNEILRGAKIGRVFSTRHEIGHTLNGDAEARQRFIATKIEELLPPMMSRVAISKFLSEHPSTKFFYEPKREFDIFVIHLPSFFGEIGRDLFRIGKYKPNILVMRRIVYENHHPFIEYCVVEISNKQAEIARHINYNPNLGLYCSLYCLSDSKRGRDSVVDFFRKINSEIRKLGFEKEEGTGILDTKQKVFVIPIIK